MIENQFVHGLTVAYASLYYMVSTVGRSSFDSTSSVEDDQRLNRMGSSSASSESSLPCQYFCDILMCCIRFQTELPDALQYITLHGLV